MPSIKDAIKKLKPYKNDLRIDRIREELKVIYKAPKGGITTIGMEHIRILIQRLYPEFENNKEISHALHTSLIAIAGVSPINELDPITSSPIRKKNQIVISTGHQFDLEKLIEFHNTRPLRTEEREKQLINPITNLPVSRLDADHIRNESKKKSLNIGDGTFQQTIRHHHSFFKPSDVSESIFDASTSRLVDTPWYHASWLLGMAGHR